MTEDVKRNQRLNILFAATARASYGLILIYLILSGGIIAAGCLYYRNHEKNYRAEVEQQLSAIAGLKMAELVQWRKERLDDAFMFYKNPAFSALVRRWFENSADEEVREQLQTWLGGMEKSLQYDRIRLHDAQLKPRMTIPAALPPLTETISQRAAWAMQSGQVTFVDFYRNEYDQQIHLNIIVPVIDVQDNSRVLGVLAMRIDPEPYFYPLINRWPTPSRTAETLLFRRDGNDVLFLNELRFKKNTALILRIPLTNVAMPAVKAAALGHEGIIEGIDYRGIPVISDIHPVPDSPWFIAARMEVAEVYEPLRKELWSIVFIVGALLLGTGTGVALLWRQQAVRFYRERYTSSVELQESEAHYRSLVEGAPGIVYSYSNLHGGLFYSSRATDILGYSPEQLYAQPKLWYNSIHPDDIARVEQSISGAMAGNSFCIEYRILDAHGSWHWFDDRSTDFKKEGSEIIIEGFALDITERKQAEDALRENRARMQMALEGTRAGLWDWNVQTGQTVFNDRWAEIVGYTLKELEPTSIQTWIDLCHPDDIQKSDKLLEKHFLKESEYYDCEVRMKHKDGHWVWVHDCGRIFEWSEDGKPQRVLGTHFDITGRKNMEEQLRQAQKMEAIGTLAGGIAHDFNNILSPIILQTEMLRDELPAGHPDRMVLDEVLQASRRAAALVKQILTFSRQIGYEQKPCKIGPVIQEALKLLQATLPSNICISAEGIDAAAAVLADPTQIHQVLMNLCTNAMHAMKDHGGELAVTLSEYTVTPEEALLLAVEPGPYMKLTMHDTGCGIDKAIMNRIFDPFFTTKKIGEGTGLGLSVVHGIVKKYGGTVIMESSSCTGTTFCVFLPRLPDDAPVEAFELSAAAAQGGTERILFVDDEKFLLDTDTKMLQKLGYAVTAFNVSSEALECFRQSPDAFDLVVTDYMMPGMTGPELIACIRQIRPGISAILCTGYSIETALEQHLPSDINAVIQKPYRKYDIAVKLRSLLDKRRDCV